MLHVSEVFRSIQGESTFAGLPCVFIRLAGCNLNCRYCDTRHARQPDRTVPWRGLVDEALALGGGIVEVTGGEPLLQPRTPQLLDALAESGRTVLLETNGSLGLPGKRRYHVIMDMKCPASGEAAAFYEPNIGRLTGRDELKFVVSSRDDFDWACQQIERHGLAGRGFPLLFAPAYGACKPAELAEWVLASGLPLRMQVQLHKVIWPHAKRGV
ncbi:MAG: 7-carboxy-7-deazaguanine synthase [Lentisphaerae bacterium ADurb.BinA184]|nr:MAG: 7-carboxy-7-deazaguanine synthase [Lentisphaerae bacterium ADurb.BinA184]